MNRVATICSAVAIPLVALVVWLAGPHRALAEVPAVTGQRPYVAPPGAGKMAPPGEWKFLGTQGKGDYSMVEIKVAELPKLPQGPGHIHTREDESWYVIEGELLFDVGEEQIKAGPGTLVYGPRDIPHRYRVTKVPARFLIIFTPAGIEPLFTEVAELRQRFPNQDGVFREELEKIQAKYGARPARGWKPASQADNPR